MLALTPRACCIDGASATRIYCVWIGTSSKKDLDSSDIAVAGRPVQGRVAVALPPVTLGAAGKKEGDYFSVAPCRGPKKGRLANRVSPIHFRSGGNQLLRFCEVACPCRSVER